LPITDKLSAGVVSLPIWSHMNTSMAERIITAISRIHAHGESL
jgi:dTDP-4-amino-4,6-dideoxygalactose transaminase